MTCRRSGSAIVCGRASRPRLLRQALPCRQPGCSRGASQASWGCQPHWFKLPPDIRNRLSLADRQEQASGAGVRGAAWRVVDDEAQAWIAEQAAKPPRVDRRQPELPL